MMSMIRVYFLLIFLGFSSYSSANIRVEQVLFSSFDISPVSLCRVNVFNDGLTAEASLQIQIKDENGSCIMSFFTLPFIVGEGFHSFSDLSIVPLQVVYGNAESARFLSIQHQLPEGHYVYCCHIFQKSNMEWMDEYCENFDSDLQPNLMLVYPFDTDTIVEIRPDFQWSHSGIFPQFPSNQFYRLVCVELKENEDASYAVENNPALFIKEYLSEHIVSFPIEYPSLESGKSYAWEVRKMSADAVVAHSGAWKFTIQNNNALEGMKYVSIGKEMNTSFYTAVNNTIFFRFDDLYADGKMTCFIFNDQRDIIYAAPQKELDSAHFTSGINQVGYNRYELDLKPLKINSGYYTLEVYNDKNECFKLKFYVP